ncbi:Uncharacterised protein [Mycobacteroides abscessus subsp. abscessus]|uniref:hypothetical protein n=1 Tax=Mycobacteroides abscessus TaxID=36809 RepID=UPI000925CD45|nr:hypothetical protein [Mycobacteroides abscessus]SIJ23044.1 Uncharacterised protein [Mycobacteroides abscessus subsp. abscessus]SIJ29238.1 Uncharacterised protein [Mycobacteroides abscessus subsp. abscessus]SIJ35739.1 Uncharacterised protein [Mycobacteroides abscessus subsp. abscessus]
MTEEIARAYELSADWQLNHQHREVFINGDHAPADEADQWVEDLISGMVAAMADAGIEVPRGPVRIQDRKVFVKLDGKNFMARDIDAEADRAPASLERVLSRFAAVAEKRGCAERWYYWYTGDPVGMAYFVTPKELITPGGVDVRELGTGDQWFEAQPD